MTNDESKLPTEPGTPPEMAGDDDLRYAPLVKVTGETAEVVESKIEPSGAPFSMSDGVDIEAALAAVSSLSDMLAEQEAAEQTRIAQAEAETRAAEERQLRVEHPEYFFPVPPSIVLKRGRMASVIPALLLIGLGVWLTLALTISEQPPDAALIVAALGVGLAVTLLARWLSSERWARGSLFFALVLLLEGGLLAYLAQSGSIGLGRGWSLLLIGLGLTFILTAIFAYPSERRLILPGLLLGFAGAIALVVTLDLLPGAVLNVAAAAWPVVLVVVLMIWLLPRVRRG